MQASVFIFLQKESVSVFNSFANIFLLYLCSFYVQVNYSGVALWGTSYLALTLAVSNRCVFEDFEKMFFAALSFFHFLEQALWIKIASCFLFLHKEIEIGRERGSVGAPNNFPSWVRLGQVCARILWVYLSAGSNSNHLSAFFGAPPFFKLIKKTCKKNMFGRLSHHKAPDSCVLGVV